MSPTIDFTEVSTAGLESSPVAEALAGLRANEARYFHNKYDHTFVTEPADESADVIPWVHDILATERDIEIASRPLEAALCDVDGISWAHVFFESGLAVNVLWTRADGGKRAVGFKLSEGMEPPPELAAFKWVRQKSRLAGTIRGTYFVIKGSHDPVPRTR